MEHYTVHYTVHYIVYHDPDADLRVLRARDWRERVEGAQPPLARALRRAQQAG